ncbi:MAG: hypothetical protein ACXW3C_14610 [Pyrinomonadaceae bacterium]
MKVALRKVLRLRLLIAVALIGWCAGAGCLTVSYARGAMGEIEDSAQALEQSMSGSPKSADAHACCKARHKSLNRSTIVSQARLDRAEQSQLTLPSTPAPGNAMKCCPLTSGNMLVGSRYQSHENALAAAQNVSIVFLNRFIPKPVAVPLRLPNRDQSYLLGCAFLI